MHWWIQGGGAPLVCTPPTGSNSFVFAYVFAKKCPRRRWVPHQREILDPLLECVDSLARALLESYKYLLPYLGNASTNELRLCTCERKIEDKVTVKNRRGEGSDEGQDVKLEGKEVTDEGPLPDLVSTPGFTEIAQKEYKRLMMIIGQTPRHNHIP